MAVSQILPSGRCNGFVVRTQSSRRTWTTLAILVSAGLLTRLPDANAFPKHRRVWHSCHAHYRFIKVWRASPYKAQSSLPHAQETVCPLRRMLPIRCCRCLFHQSLPHCASTERQSPIVRATSMQYVQGTSLHHLQQVSAAPSMPCHRHRVRTWCVYMPVCPGTDRGTVRHHLQYRNHPEIFLWKDCLHYCSTITQYADRMVSIIREYFYLRDQFCVSWLFIHSYMFNITTKVYIYF